MHCLTIEFMGDLEESARGIFREKSQFRKKGRKGVLNPDPMERRFGSADVYGGSEISINRGRIPGSRVRGDKNNDTGGKGTGWECQRAENFEELRERWGN